MPATDCATDVAPPGSQSESSQIEDTQIDAAQRGSGGSSRLLKGFFFGFAATVTIGLALASWYVRVRIVAANEVAPSTTRATAPVNATPAPTPAQAQPAVTGDSAVQADWHNVPPAYLYLQVAGLGIKQDTDLANSLETKGFHAQVQMRDGSATRILIGPFSTHAEIEQGQRKLKSAGVLAVETTY